MSVLDEAVRLASQGFAVFPVHAVSKRPLTENGFKDASRDVRVVRTMFSTRPRAVIGLATGSRSANRGRALLVVDRDDHHGGREGLEAAQANLGDPGATATASTPSGGIHWYYRVPPGITVPNSAGKLAPGVDIRAEGGYVVAPPAPGREWTVKVSMAELPPAWIEALGASPDGHTPRVPGDEWAALLRAIPEGQRNQSLARITGHLLAKNVSVHMAAGLVHLVNRTACRPPLPTSEVDRILDSIARAELAKRQRRTL